MKEYTIVVQVPDDMPALLVAEVVIEAAEHAEYRLAEDGHLDVDVEVHFGTEREDVSYSLIRNL